MRLGSGHVGLVFGFFSDPAGEAPPDGIPDGGLVRLRELAARRAERAYAAHRVAATPRINGRNRREL